MAGVSNVLSTPRALRLFQRKRVGALFDAADTLGKCVYVYGDKIGDRYQFRTCDPTDPAKMPAAGVIIVKDTATEGIVQVFGEIPNTLYSGLTPGSQLYVGLSGSLTHTKPTTGYVQHAGEAFGAEEPFFWPFAEVVGITVGFERVEQDLIGLKNGANLTYTTPEKFDPGTVRVYRNGVRQDKNEDYTVVEGGGPGTGYDTVIFATEAPLGFERLFADYTTTL